jgi:uncharacterized protein DUF4160
MNRIPPPWAATSCPQQPGCHVRIVTNQSQLGVPHFHALYAGQEASVAIETLEVLAGALPDRALRLVREWASLHRAELEDDWQRARDGLPLERIPPLA